MEKVLVIYIRCVKDILSLSAQEQFPDEQRPIEYVEDRPISHADINANCFKLFNYLNSDGKQAKFDRTIYEHIKHISQILCDQLFTIKIKELIKNTKCQDLILKIDGSLVHVPWELLHLGGNYLCQRFSIGRMVSTRQPITNHITRKYQKPLKMLVLADTKGDLDAAYEEGMIIEEKFTDLHKDLKINLKTTFIRTESIKKSLREYDIIHYAGHAEYELKDPSRSGWRTADGLLSTLDIINMRGGDPLPLLIFSNACQSGEAEPWTLMSDGERVVYGLPNAFLLSGVQHYIGTFWKIPDRAGLRLAVAFYQNLLNRLPIGESLRRARLHFIKTHGEENTTWMAYMLYGNPIFNYFGQEPPEKAETAQKEKVFDRKPEIKGYETVTSGIPEEKIRAASKISVENEFKSITPKRFSSHIIRSLQLAIYALILLSVLAGAVIVLRHFNYIFYSGQKMQTKENQAEIDLLIKEIENRLKERPKKISTGPEDIWTSRPMSMAVFGYFSKDDLNSGEERKIRRLNEVFVRQITTAIKNQSAIPLVDRSHLDEIFKEYKYSLSDFADKRKELILFARFLGARLIMFSEILPYKKDYNLDITIIETETSLIKARFSSPVEKKIEYEAVVSQIVNRVINEIGACYPLQCIIKIQDNPNEVCLNIGSGVGLRPGTIFTILGKRGELRELGHIKVIIVEQDMAQATVLETKRPLRDGDRAFSNVNPYI